MKNIKDGKSVDSRMLANCGEIKEIASVVDTYAQIMQGLAKNTFETSSVESKTAVILERMADGVIAFSMQRQIIQINTAAKNFAGLTAEDNTYETAKKIIAIIE